MDLIHRQTPFTADESFAQNVCFDWFFALELQALRASSRARTISSEQSALNQGGATALFAFA